MVILRKSAELPLAERNSAELRPVVVEAGEDNNFRKVGQAVSLIVSCCGSVQVL